MNLLMAIVIGTLYGTAVYLILRRSIVKLILGLGLLGNATNLLIFTVGGLTRDGVPLIHEGQKELEGIYANPLPQALILTAIVIGLASIAFAVVLINRTYQIIGTDDVDMIHMTDKPS